MPIRRREKPLTPQEAIDLAKKELFPFWQGAEPLLAAVQTGNEVKAFPLDSAFGLRPWLISFIDPTELSAAEAFAFARFCAKRYEAQRLGALVFLRARYSFLNADWMRKWANAFSGQFSNSFAAALDASGLMARAFQVASYPAFVLMNQGNVFFNRQEKWFDGTENEIQRFFRVADPGLPLFPPLQVEEPLIAPLPSFEPSFSGNWKREGDAMVTEDPKATVSFTAPGSKLGLVAQAVRKVDPNASTEAVVELNDEFGKAVIPAPDLRVDSRAHESVAVDRQEKCRAALPLAEPRLYTVFRNLPATHREVTLRFPGAASVGVAIYGIRFAR